MSQSFYKKSPIQAIIAQVSQIPILDVLQKYGVTISRVTSSKAYGLCPYHMDNTEGSWVVNLNKNSNWCYSCNKGGGVIITAKELLHVDKLEAILQVAADFKIITPAQFESYLNDEYVQKGLEDYEKISQNTTIRKKKPKESKTIAEWTQVYSFAKEYFGLSDEHKVYLSETRHLEAERIATDYFSIDTSTKAKRRGLTYALTKQFPDTNFAKKIPGFYEEANSKGEWNLSVMAYKGVGILLRNAKGSVVGVQIRLEKEDKSGQRYKYLSWETGNTASFREGSSCGTPIDVMYPDNIEGKIKVAVVEGRFKAEILRQQGFITLSVQGVHNFVGIENDIKDIESITGRKIDSVYLFYDADMLHNIAVFGAAKKLTEYLREECQISTIFAYWNETLGKGVDDCILAGNRDMIKFMPAEAMIKKFEKTIEAVATEESIDLQNIAALSKEERMDFLNSLEKRLVEDLNISTR